MLEKIIEIAKPYCSEDLDWNEDISIMSDMELSSLDFFAFISTVEEYFNIHLPDGDYDTFAGFVLSLSNEFPSEKKNIVLTYQNFSFKITRLNKRKIEEILVTLND